MAELTEAQKSSIRDAVLRSEGAQEVKYEASFAGGNSGLSFGGMQNDVGHNNDAKTHLMICLRTFNNEPYCLTAGRLPCRPV